MRSRNKTTELQKIPFPVVENVLEAVRQNDGGTGTRARKTSGKAAHPGKVFAYEHRPNLREGEVFVFIIDRDMTVAKTVQVAPVALNKAGAPKLLDLAATRLAEIELVAHALLAPPRPELHDAELGAAEKEQLRRGGFELGPQKDDLGDPVAQAKAEYASIVAESLTVDEAASLLDVNGSRIRQRLGKRSLYGIKTAGGAWRIPKFQFQHDAVIPGLEAVLPAIRTDVHPVAFHRWLTSPKPDLVLGDSDKEQRPASPLDWLASGGDPARVVELAADL